MSEFLPNMMIARGHKGWIKDSGPSPFLENFNDLASYNRGLKIDEVWGLGNPKVEFEKNISPGDQFGEDLREITGSFDLWGNDGDVMSAVNDPNYQYRKPNTNTFRPMSETFGGKDYRDTMNAFKTRYQTGGAFRKINHEPFKWGSFNFGELTARTGMNFSNVGLNDVHQIDAFDGNFLENLLNNAPENSFFRVIEY